MNPSEKLPRWWHSVDPLVKGALLGYLCRLLVNSVVSGKLPAIRWPGFGFDMPTASILGFILYGAFFLDCYARGRESVLRFSFLGPALLTGSLLNYPTYRWRIYPGTDYFGAGRPLDFIFGAAFLLLTFYWVRNILREIRHDEAARLSKNRKILLLISILIYGLILGMGGVGTSIGVLFFGT